MSEPYSTFSSNTLNTSAMSKVATLPELIALIGHHLPQSDLFSCVQVCYHWNKILIPELWQIIDTRKPSWIRLLQEDAAAETTRPPEETTEWLQTIFAKHGHHIRHLGAHWHIVLEAAVLSSGCRNLESLTVGTVWYYRGISGATRTQTPHTPATTLTATTATSTSAGGLQLPWQSSSLVNNNIWPEKNTQQHTLEYFWALVRHNPKLTRLIFPNFVAMNGLPMEFIINTLFLLTCFDQLQELDLTWSLLGVREVLKALPRLKRLHVYNLMDVSSIQPQEQFPSLRMLDIRVFVDPKAILRLLPHLPGLKEFRVRRLGISDTALTPEDLEDIAAAAESAIVTATSISGQQDMPVTIFQVDTFPEIDDKIMALFVGVFPRLKRIRVPGLFRETQKALWARCYFLEAIESSNMRNVKNWEQRRREDALKGVVK
ncbi:hypothetical protein BGW39_011804 [Mortierella sp. 14UC]|nr:hypothetical protein BGW39_011804 [Mortierella sp. 14UC]